MKTLAELQAIRDKAREKMTVRGNNEEAIRVVVGMATCGIAAGARPVLLMTWAERAAPEHQQAMTRAYRGLAASTGALLAAATLLVKRIRGIRRAALAPVVPTGNGGAVLIDCGANAECPPEYLMQFAYMGSYYAEHVLGRPEPRVGLLNIGVEPSKGTELQRTVYPMLQNADQEGRIRFVGNIEAREAVEGSVDVIVADGYSGNIFLKTMEGTGLFLAREIKKIFKQNLLTKLAAVMVSGGLKRFKKLMDSSEVGGTALVGISKTVIKAHGSSNAYAFQNAIRQASQSVSSGLIENITANIDLMRLDAPEKE